MAGTPGCTTEAGAFRDAIDKIKILNTQVYGVSADTIKDQKAFHAEHKLNFDVLPDDEMKVIRQFDAKMLILSMSKRWPFILGPELIIRSIQKDVDPAVDAQRVAETVSSLQNGES